MAVPVTINDVVTAITTTGATVGGTVTHDGVGGNGSGITSRGVVFNIKPPGGGVPNDLVNSSPDQAGVKGTVTLGSGLGHFSTTLTGLTPATSYNVRAWAINSAGTGYAVNVAFTTLTGGPPPPPPPPTAASILGAATQVPFNGAGESYEALTDFGTMVQADNVRVGEVYPAGSWPAGDPHRFTDIVPLYTRWKAAVADDYVMDTHTGLRQAGLTWTQCSTGSADAAWQATANKYVSAGWGTSPSTECFVRMGLEFNYTGSGQYALANGGSGALFIATFKRCVNVMRAIAPWMSFCWNPSYFYSAATMIPDNFFPSGNDTVGGSGRPYVNRIGMDVYDQHPWATILGASSASSYSLRWLDAYAQSKGLPIYLPEWGLWRASNGGNGDNVTFAQNMCRWLKGTYDGARLSTVVSATYYQLGTANELSQFPNGLAAIIAEFAHAPPPVIVPPPVATGPANRATYPNDFDCTDDPAAFDPLQAAHESVEWRALQAGIEGTGVVSGLGVTAPGGMKISVDAGTNSVRGATTAVDAIDIDISPNPTGWPRRDSARSDSTGSYVVEGTAAPIPVSKSLRLDGDHRVNEALLATVLVPPGTPEGILDDHITLQGVPPASASSGGAGWTAAPLVWQQIGTPTAGVTSLSEQIVTATTDPTALLFPGHKVQLGDGGAVKYYIVTKVDGAGNVTLLAPAGQAQLASIDVGSFQYSWTGGPGFPPNPDSWSCITTQTTDNSVSGNPTTSAWYPSGLSITIPCGLWEIEFVVSMEVNLNAVDAQGHSMGGRVGLGNVPGTGLVNHPESAPDGDLLCTFTFQNLWGGPAHAATMRHTFVRSVRRIYTTPGTPKHLYLNALSGGEADSIVLRGSVADTIIRARSLYL